MKTIVITDEEMLMITQAFITAIGADYISRDRAKESNWAECERYYSERAKQLESLAKDLHKRYDEALEMEGGAEE